MEIPSQTDYLAVVHEVTLRLAQDAGFQDDEAEQLALCVDEAATNVIEHAYHGLPDGRIELSFMNSVAGFSIDLIDHGARIDEDAMPTFDSEQYMEEGRTGGMGVHLISRIMDSLSYDCDRERNVCRLTKRKTGRARRPGSRRVEARRRILEHLGSGPEPDPIACSRLLRLASLVDVFDNLDHRARCRSGARGRLARGPRQPGLYERDAVLVRGPCTSSASLAWRRPR